MNLLSSISDVGVFEVGEEALGFGDFGEVVGELFVVVGQLFADLFGFDEDGWAAVIEEGPIHRLFRAAGAEVGAGTRGRIRAGRLVVAEQREERMDQALLGRLLVAANVFVEVFYSFDVVGERASLTDL